MDTCQDYSSSSQPSLLGACNAVAKVSRAVVPGVVGKPIGLALNFANATASELYFCSCIVEICKCNRRKLIFIS